MPAARPVPLTPAAGAARPRLLNLSPLAQLRAGRLPRRLAQLFIGLSLFGVSIPLMLRGGLGSMPWDVLHLGLAQRLPFSIGVVMIAVSALVLLAWVPLRQMPGLGTLANAVWIGIVTDIVLRFLPAATALPWQLGYTLAGIVLNGVATAMYIGSQLGPGPRDGLMTGLARVTGRSLRLARTSIEIVVVAAGWLLGGVVGFGTLAYALAVGPLTQFFLPFFTVDLGAGAAATPGSTTVSTSSVASRARPAADSASPASDLPAPSPDLVP